MAGCGYPANLFVKKIEEKNGARSTINEYGPTLAICLHHKFSDFVEIPQWFTANFPDYEFRLSHYTIFEDETVLYAKK